MLVCNEMSYYESQGSKKIMKHEMCSAKFELHKLLHIGVMSDGTLVNKAPLEMLIIPFTISNLNTCSRLLLQDDLMDVI